MKGNGTVHGTRQSPSIKPISCALNDIGPKSNTWEYTTNHLETCCGTVHRVDCISGHITEDTTERKAQWIGRVSRALCYLPDFLIPMGFNVPLGHSPQCAQ